MTKLTTPKKHIPTAQTNLINMIGASTPVRLIIRELVINGWESLYRKIKSGTGLLPGQGIIIKCIEDKICFIDHGEGLTREQVTTHLASLGFTGNNMTFCPITGKPVLDGNKGIGAKTSALPKNQYGMQYYTLVDGECESFILHLDDEGHYAFKKFVEEDYQMYFEPPLEEVFEIFGSNQSGVAVKLLGMTSEENTWNTICADCESTTYGKNKARTQDYAGNTIVKFLNHRFYKNIFEIIDSSLRVQTSTTDSKNLPGQDCKGTKHYLKHYSDKVVSKQYHVLGIDVKVEWHFLKKSRTTSNPAFETNCFNAFVHINEIYGDFLEGASSRYATAKRLGITAGFKDVVTLIHLPEDNSSITTDAARTSLMLNGSQIQMLDFQLVVAEDLPIEVIEYLKNEYSQSLDTSQLESEMKKILKDLLAEFPTSESNVGQQKLSDVQTNIVQNNSLVSLPVKEPQPRKNKTSRKSKFNSGKELPEISIFDMKEPEVNAAWHPIQYRININNNSQYFNFLKEIYFNKYDYQGDTLNNKLLNKIAMNVFEYIAHCHLYFKKKSDQEIDDLIFDGINAAAILKREQIKTLTRHLGANAA